MKFKKDKNMIIKETYYTDIEPLDKLKEHGFKYRDNDGTYYIERDTSSMGYTYLTINSWNKEAIFRLSGFCTSNDYSLLLDLYDKGIIKRKQTMIQKDF